MARHFTIRSFFRQVPNALLARYFRERGMLPDLDFEAMKETKPDALFDAWLALPDRERMPIEVEFREIFDLSCAKGFSAIVDELRFQKAEDPTAADEVVVGLSKLPSHYHRAMTAFLDHKECWRGATRFFSADVLPYWRKRKNLGHDDASIARPDVEELARKIGEYFHFVEGRGRNCVVECLRRGDLDYYFAYPEDHSERTLEWENGTFAQRPHHPAFEVVYVYSQKDGTLDLNYRGPYKAIEPLQALFATTILKKAELPPDPEDTRVYDLNRMQNRSFQFVYPPDSGIARVAIKSIRLSSRVRQGNRVTLEADPKRKRDAIYDLLDEFSTSTSLRAYNVTQVGIVAEVLTSPDKPAKSISFNLTYPNSCTLKYEELDLKLRAMLEASGIEPKAVEDSDAA